MRAGGKAAFRLAALQGLASRAALFRSDSSPDSRRSSLTAPSALQHPRAGWSRTPGPLQSAQPAALQQHPRQRGGSGGKRPGSTAELPHTSLPGELNAHLHLQKLGGLRRCVRYYTATGQGETEKRKRCLQKSCPEPPPTPVVTSRLSSASTRINLEPLPSEGKQFNSAALWQPCFDFLLRS